MFLNTSIFIPRVLLYVLKHVLVISGYPLPDATLSGAINRVMLYVVLGCCTNDDIFKEAAVHLGLDITKCLG